MSLIRAPQQRFQPQGTGALNDAHPLRRYVKFAFLGSAGKHRDLTGRHSLAQGASAALGSSTAGIGLVSAANNTWVHKQLSTAELNDFTGDITLVWHGVVLGVNAGANNRLISVLYGDGASSPFSIADLYRLPSDNTQISFATNNGSFQSVTFTPNFSAHNGSPITLVVSNRAGEATVLFVSRPIGSSAVVASANLGAAAGSPRSSIANSQLTIGGQQVNGSHPNATTSAALILNRAVSQQEAVWISQNVWSFFSSPSRDIATSLMYVAAGGSGATGTLLATLGTLTSSASGTVAIVGSSSQTLGSLTSAATGTVQVKGASTATLGALTSTSAGTVAVVGSASNTLGALTLSSAGTTATGPVGTLSATLGSLTSSAAGTVQVRGTSTQTLGELTSASAGAVRVAGSLSATLGALTLAGGDLNASTGGLSATLDGLTVVAVGTAPLVWTVQTPANASWAAQSSSGSWVVQSVTASSWALVA